MTRISRCFERLRGEGRKAFVGFVTAGDPSIERTVEVALELEKGGVDILELGVPFSDPLADGPVIQRASERALGRGTTLAGVLKAVRAIRRASELPLLLFSYVNPLLRYGLPALAAEATDAGVAQPGARRQHQRLPRRRGGVPAETPRPLRGRLA